jgi:hypothetical protein
VSFGAQKVPNVPGRKENMLIKSLLVAVFLIFPVHAFSDTDTTSEKLLQKNPDIDKYEFSKAFISSLGDVSSAVSRFKKGDEYAKDDVQSTIALMKDTKRSSSDYARAADKVKEFVNSKNELIALMATSLANAYESHIKLNDESIALLEELYSPNAFNNPNKVDLGKFMSRQADFGAKHEEFMRLLMQTSMYLGQILVSPRVNSDGNLSTIGITRSQREDLIKELELHFDEKVKNGIKKDTQELNYFEASGAFLYEFLANSEMKTLDK